MKEERNKYSGMFTMLAMMFVACMIVSNLLAGKIWNVWGDINIPASAILFPVAYILADVFTEVYGFKKARFVIWTGFACNFLAVFGYVITVVLPYPKYWLFQDAFAIVFGMAPRFLVASFAGYLFGEFSNSIILSKLKVKTEGKNLWLRLMGSTVVGEAIDTVIFAAVSYALVIPWSQIFKIMIFQYLFKVCFEAVLMPLTYWVTGALKKREGIDTFDTDVRYRLI